jgi:hypothetical protein
MTNRDLNDARASAAAPLADAAGLVSVMRGVATHMAEDLVERARDPRIEPSLRLSHQAARDAHETSDAYEIWRKGFCDQVAASWVLGAVFVRTLEDRGFLPHRLAGPGALDRFAQFRRMFRYLSERDYLLHIFDALAEPPPSWPAGRDAADWMGAQVFGRTSAPLWKLSPSQRALAELLDVLRSVDATGALRFTFGRPEGVEHDGSTTRFLGDLYQDLNADVRKRYALLQTPDFVERFILDQTLTPALQERGIAVTLCDPACGSGHFLLGAYDRLFEARQQHEPGRPRVEVARQALSQVYGVDLNPYAAAIARFRLLLSFLDKAGLTRLDQIPPGLRANIFIGDSLLAGRLTVERGTTQQFGFGDVVKDVGFALGKGFSLVDHATEELLKNTRFDVVVGNPPYITEKDAEKRELIRQAYPRSATGKYALSAPFVERIVDLASPGGWTGQITANAFMKREFGRPLIEKFLSQVDLSLVIDAQHAKFPGHGTPTAFLFVRARTPVAANVRVMMGRSAERLPPEGPEDSELWKSIVRNVGSTGVEDEFFTIVDMARSKLIAHPWTLGGGGASDAKESMESASVGPLRAHIDSIGIVAFTLEDDVFVGSQQDLLRRGLEQTDIVPFIEGHTIRDWAMLRPTYCIYPYGKAGPQLSDKQCRALWPWKITISSSIVFEGRTKTESGVPWYAFGYLNESKMRNPEGGVFSFIATHNHVSWISDASVCNRSSPVIKFKKDELDEDHSFAFAMLAYLGSSAACFWQKQVMQPKGTTSANHNHPSPERVSYEFGARALGELPIPAGISRLAALGKVAIDLAAERQAIIRHPEKASPETLLTELRERWPKADVLKQRLVAVQEEIDWTVYELFGFINPTQWTSLEKAVLDGGRCRRGERPFEVCSGHISFVRESGVLLTPDQAEADEAGGGISDALVSEYRVRAGLIQSNPLICLFECYLHKRLFRDTEENIREAAFRQNDDLRIAESRVLQEIEGIFAANRGQPAVLSVATLLQHLERLGMVGVLEWLQRQMRVATEIEVVSTLCAEQSVPGASSQIYSADGIEKRRLWENTWNLQRREDAGEKLSVPVPPKFDKDDFENSAIVWRHRGKLDVPKERFIAYPTATPPPGASGSAGLVFGWAGWTHLKQLQAAIALWQDEWAEHGSKVLPRTTRDARDAADPTVLADLATREKLLPILQTMVDLLPWVRQWHNEDGETAEQFENYVKEECRKVEMSLDEVHLFRLAKKVKATKAPKAPKTAAPALDDDAVLAAATDAATGGTVEASAIAERLGVAPAKLKAHLDALVERGALVQTKARPRTFRGER